MCSSEYFISHVTNSVVSSTIFLLKSKNPEFKKHIKDLQNRIDSNKYFINKQQNKWPRSVFVIDKTKYENCKELIIGLLEKKLEPTLAKLTSTFAIQWQKEISPNFRQIYTIWD